MIPLSAALLAGGKSTRMGRDKCLLELAGLPLWRRQLNVLASLSDDLMVVAPERPAWLPADARFVPDAAPNSGPLAGLVAALSAMRHERLLVLAVDLPRVTPDLLARLASAKTALVPQIGEPFEPLCATYPRAAHPVAAAHLARGDLALQSLVRALGTTGLIHPLTLSASEAATFVNLNHPHDLAAFASPAAPERPAP